jgi:hypothetical protein
MFGPRKIVFNILAVVLLAVVGRPTSLVDPGLADQALSTDAPQASHAINRLRQLGYAGIDALLERAEQYRSAGDWDRFTSALDRVSGQRDSYNSRLYWHTDLEQARAAARAQGKPILSLRLLGRLDEELSCANSRLFRLTLYSNQQVANLLRDRFILHWKSVRNAPKVTIDFGDGRKLERTLTGNSIHYILDSEGRVVDALPGLYGARTFLTALERGQQAARISSQLSGAAHEAFLRQYHTAMLDVVERRFTADLAKLGIASMPESGPAVKGQRPKAEEAARVAMTKMVVVERPLLRSISTNPAQLRDRLDDVVWARLGRLRLGEAILDQTSRALIRSKLPADSSEAEAQMKIEILQASIATDTARNEYIFHRTLYRWFIDGMLSQDLDTLNERIYSDLFLTPGSDPWLGLLPSDGFTGIENEGILTK